MVAIWKCFPVEVEENENEIYACKNAHPHYFYHENMYGFPINFKNTFYWYAKVKDYDKLNYVFICSPLDEFN